MKSTAVNAAALVLRRTFSPLKLNILYVPKGPALDYANAALVDRVLRELVDVARRDRAIFIKIDPDLNQADRSLLLDRGWRYSAEQIQFRNTMLLDLTRSEDDLLAAMKPKTRYNVRLAQKKGVTIRSGDLGDLELLYAMYAETAQRDGFIIRPLDYYRDAWGSFIRSDCAHPLIAEVDQRSRGGPHPLSLRRSRLVHVRHVAQRAPRQNAQSSAAMGSDALGQSARLHRLRSVGRAR